MKVISRNNINAHQLKAIFRLEWTSHVPIIDFLCSSNHDFIFGSIPDIWPFNRWTSVIGRVDWLLLCGLHLQYFVSMFRETAHL